MKKFFTLVGLSAAMTLTAATPNASFAWALGGGGATADYTYDVATDGSGNIFMANSFTNTATFNGVQLTGSAKGSGANFDNSLYVCKLSPAKENLWKLYSNEGAVTPAALVTTANGDLIVAGSIRAVKGGATTSANLIDAAGTITTFTNLGNATAYDQSFVAKFNSAGILQWVKELNSSATKDTTVETSALATDASGNVYLTGTFAKGLSLPAATPLTATSTNTSQAAFIAKLDGKTGDAVWLKKTSGGIKSEAFTALTVGDDGALYVAGDVANAATPIAVTIGGKSFTPSQIADLVLIKLDTDGNVAYVQERPNLSTTAGKDVRVKDIVVKNGKAFVCGSVYASFGGIQFTGNTLTSTSTYLNGFTAAFNTSDGSDVWQKAVLAPAIAEVSGAVIGKDGNLFVCGYHYNALGTAVTAGPVNFGDTTLVDATNKLGDLFLASYDPATGKTQEVHLSGKGPGSELSFALAGYDDKVYVAARTNSKPLTFEDNTTTYSTAGVFDFVLVCYKDTVPKSAAIHDQKSVPAYAFYNKASQSVVIANGKNIVSVAIYDMTGRLVETVKTAGSSEFSARGIKSGIYMVRATTSNDQKNVFKLAVN
ncbi:MAG: T9SS type A sorting domain-containing protein [Bacteroidota bacterium]|nr:T9SS type A sorting domain-containing protein [Bacteroidota bacterium]